MTGVCSDSVVWYRSREWRAKLTGGVGFAGFEQKMLGLKRCTARPSHVSVSLPPNMEPDLLDLVPL